MTTIKYKIIVQYADNSTPFHYICQSLEELCFVYKFLQGYQLFRDEYKWSDVTVQRSRTKKEILDNWYSKDYVCLTEDDDGYWVSYTDELEEHLKTKSVKL